MKFIPHLALIPLLSLAVSQQAHADEFHFGSAAKAAKMTEDSEPDMVRGVLIEREGRNLVIRVVGGVISVPQSLVYKIVSDDLTENDIVNEEIATAEILAEANGYRLQFQANEAAERLARTREARHREAELQRAHAESRVHHPADHGLSYDPIIHRSVGSMLDFVVSGYIQQELGGHIRRHVQRSIRKLRRNHY